MIGVSVGDTTLGTTIANLGMADTRFAHPVFIGDTLRAETTVAEKRESRSRPTRVSSCSTIDASTSAPKRSPTASGRR